MNLPSEYDLIQMEQCADQFEDWDDWRIAELCRSLRALIELVRSLRP